MYDLRSGTGVAVTFQKKGDAAESYENSIVMNKSTVR